MIDHDRPSQVSGRVIIAFLVPVVVICLLPTILNNMGMDFATLGTPLPVDAVPTTDDLFHRLSGSFTHALLEWSAFCVAAFTVVLAFAHFRTHRTDAVMPIIGLALFFAGCMDAFHTLAAARLIDATADNKDLIPYTWAICRAFDAMVMIAGMSILLWGNRNRRRRADLTLICGAGLFFGLAGYAIIHFCATRTILPQTMFPDAAITRPWDVVALVLFVFAGLVVYPFFYWRQRSAFSLALWISAIPEVATQLHMAFGSTALFDNHFNIAHFLKVVAYLVPCAGLMYNYVLAEQQVREARDELDTFFSVSLEMMCIAGTDGYFKRLNPAFEKILGYTDDELKATPFIEFVHPDDRERMASTLADMIESKVPLLDFESRYRSKTGEYVWLEWSCSAPMEGGLLYAVARDATERHTYQASLIEAKNRAEEATRTKSEFLANMSHEIRTPMNAIIGYSECMLAGMDGPITDEQMKSLGRVTRSSQNLLMLIDNILDISKVEAGQMEVVLAEFDLLEALTACIDTVSPLVASKGLAIDTEFSSNDLVITGDVMRIRQIIINLLSNAIKFTETGVVHVTMKSNDDSVIVMVKDEGIGITAEELLTVFDAFTQADSSTTKKYGGTGLGLSISRTFAEMHGGSLVATSEQGVGSTFTLTLPRRHGSASSTATAPTAPGTVLAAENDEESSLATLMVIDDDPAVIDYCVKQLGDSGYRIVGVTDSTVAIEQIRDIMPRAVLWDLMMPEIDGFEILCQLREDPDLSHIPVIVISCFNNRDIIRKMGVDHYISKPLERDVLLSKIEMVLDFSKKGLIAVVEDDAGDQDLIRKYLGGNEWKLVFYENGKEAVDGLKERKPDLIILDLIMPEMDGFTFLSEMKEHGLDDIPVIVMSNKELAASELRQLAEQTETTFRKSGLTRPDLVDAVRKVLGD